MKKKPAKKSMMDVKPVLPKPGPAVQIAKSVKKKNKKK